MKRSGILVAMVVMVASLLLGEQIQAAAAQANFPIPGKAVNVIVPYPAGGGTSIAAMEISSLLEKYLKVPFQVLHRPGAGSQVGLTELARSKPDGYTIGYVGLPSTIVIYSDPQRKAVYARKSFQPVALHFAAPQAVSVRASGPYKTLKDVIDAAKAEPGKLRIATNGLMTVSHLAGLLLEKAAGVKFAFVHFDGDAPTTTALQGGHVDATCLSASAIYPHVKSGAARSLGVMDTDESPQLPGVRTLQSQGYNVHLGTTAGLNAPAGTPREAVDILAEALKKNMNSEAHKAKMLQLGFTLRYLDPDQYAALWNQMETRVITLLQEIKKQ